MNRPLALVCFICGRQFGTKSLGIHIKSCQKKWQNQQNLFDPKKRRPCPKAPKGFMELISKPNLTRKDIDNFNTGSFDTYMEEGLVQCEYCGRKFNEKSLHPHQKACRTNPMIRKPYVSKQEKLPNNSQFIPKKSEYTVDAFESAENVNQDLVPCRKCGRKFNSDRVGKHEKVCKQTKKTQTPKVGYGKPVQNGYGKPMQSGFSNKSNITKPSMLKKKDDAFVQKKDPKWKVQSEQLQKAMKQMRKIKQFQQNGGNLKDLPPPERSNYDHYVQCKYCGRNYAPDVAQRHIPKCANIINKPGGIKPSRIQEKYVGSTGSTGTRKVQTTVTSSTTSSKTYQLGKGGVTGTKQPIQPIQPTQPVKTSMLKPKLMTGSTIKKR